MYKLYIWYEHVAVSAVIVPRRRASATQKCIYVVYVYMIKRKKRRIKKYSTLHTERWKQLSLFAVAGFHFVQRAHYFTEFIFSPRIIIFLLELFIFSFISLLLKLVIYGAWSFWMSSVWCQWGFDARWTENWENDRGARWTFSGFVWREGTSYLERKLFRVQQSDLGDLFQVEICDKKNNKTTLLGI